MLGMAELGRLELSSGQKGSLVFGGAFFLAGMFYLLSFSPFDI